MRKFKCIKGQRGKDDLGFSGIVFECDTFIMGKVYEEIDTTFWDENAKNSPPFITDETGCSHKIGSSNFWEYFEEVEDYLQHGDYVMHLSADQYRELLKMEGFNGGHSQYWQMCVDDKGIVFHKKNKELYSLYDGENEILRELSPDEFKRRTANTFKK